jgi:hypothetical protein
MDFFPHIEDISDLFTIANMEDEEERKSITAFGGGL